MTNYTFKTYAIGTAEPVSKLFPLAHDAEAIETGRSLLGRRKGVRQVEVWHGQRRLVSFERGGVRGDPPQLCWRGVGLGRSNSRRCRAS